MSESPDHAREPSQPDLTPRPPGRRFIRWGLNLALVVHLAAIIIAPASVSPSSDLARDAWDLVYPYLQVFYLNNGYHFFAPEPGESTLLAYVAEREDGTVVRGRIPNFDIKPRLLYHRHFMISEHMVIPPPELREPWFRSYARHLLDKYDAQQVSLTMLIHYLPTMEMVREGIRLDEPESYEEVPLGVYRWDEL